MVLKQLIEEAALLFEKNGMKAERIHEILAPAQFLVDNPRELLPTAPGAALFLGPETRRLFALRETVDPRVETGNRFFLKPLIEPAFQNPPFTLLCLNRGAVKVYSGDRFGLREQEIEGMPVQLADVTAIDDPEKSLQQHTGTTTSASGRPGSSPAMEFHGQGLPADYASSQYERFFREGARHVNRHLTGRKDWLVVFGVEQNMGIFRDQYKWQERPFLSRIEDASRWDQARLHTEAWEPVASRIEEITRQELEAFAELEGKDTGLFAAEPASLAAASGRIDSVLVAADRILRGICDPQNGEVRIVDRDEPGCAGDLFNYIATETLRNGGTVRVLPAERIPGGKGVAARTRY